MNHKRSEQRVLSASVWSVGGFVVGQLLRFGGNLVLTRLLLPEYFGIMGIVTVVILGLTMFSDLGLLQSVVQSRKGETSIFLNTAWTIQVIRGVVLSIVMLAFAASIQFGINIGLLGSATVYGNELLPSVLLILSLIPLLNGLESTKIFIANRRLDLKSITILEIASQFVGLCVMIFLAWNYPTIWSLVSGVIVTAITKTVLSHVVLTGISNRFLLNREVAGEIIGYGKWVMLASISGFLLSQGDRLLLGGFIDAHSLGIYTIAYFLASAVLLGLARLNRMVFFPALSDIAREEEHRLKEFYYKIRSRTDIVVLLVAGMLFVSGQSIIDLLYDDRYKDAGWMLEVLGLSVIGVTSIVADQIFLATGHSKWMSMTSLAQLIFLYAGLPIAYGAWGLHGAIWVIAFAFIPKYLVGLHYLNKLEILSIIREIRFLPFIIVGLGLGYVLDNVLIIMS